MGRYAERCNGGSDQSGGAGYPSAGEDATHYPNLVEFLSLDRWTDGSKRRLGTIRLMVEGGRLKVCFNDNGNDRYAFVCVDSLDAILGDMERLLASDDVDWRFSQRNGKR